MIVVPVRVGSFWKRRATGTVYVVSGEEYRRKMRYVTLTPTIGEGRVTTKYDAHVPFDFDPCTEKGELVSDPVVPPAVSEEMQKLIDSIKPMYEQQIRPEISAVCVLLETIVNDPAVTQTVMRSLAKVVGLLYSELLNAGLPESLAADVVRAFVAKVEPKDVVSKIPGRK